MSFTDDRRLTQVAASPKSPLEAVAKQLGKDPKGVAKAARRLLGVSLKASSRPKPKG
jgi:hypothetical protein